MNCVKQLEGWLEVAQQLGYQVRYDYFGGTGGGICQFGGRKYLFVDLALSPQDQLDAVARALRKEPLLAVVPAARLLEAEEGRERAA